MLEDIKQAEMDAAERYVIDKLKAQPWFAAAEKWGFLNVQKHIDTFETMIRPHLLDNGFLDVPSAKAALSGKYPILNFLNVPNMRLTDVVKKII